MIHELRIYHCAPRKLSIVLKRFEHVVLPLWKKHGIRQAGFWTVVVGPNSMNDMYYLIEWESMAEREAKWGAFAADPEWTTQYNEIEDKDGPIAWSIDSMFLKPTAFSAVK